MLVEGMWNWEPSGDKFNFTDWAPSEPNNKHSDEDCAAIVSQLDTWVESKCAENHQFICERL